MLAHLLDENPLDRIEAAVASGADPIVGLIDAAWRFAAGEFGAYFAGGQQTAKWIGAQLRRVEKREPVFDASDPVAVQWAQQAKLDQVREITDEQRILIRDSLIKGARTGANPRVIAKEIRASIGLTEYQSRIVDNYRRELESGGREYIAAMQRELSSGVSDRVIAAAARDGRALTPAQIETAVDRYRANWIAMRSEAIARTEGLRIAHQATADAYQQAIERGDLDPGQIKQEWLTSHLPNVRHTHQPMDRQVRAYGEPFTTGAGVLLRYPCDPAAPIKETANCACVVVTRVNRVPSAQVAPSNAVG